MKKRKSRSNAEAVFLPRTIIVQVVFFSISVSAATASVPPYHLFDLGTFPGGSFSYAYGINSNGQVVGYANTNGNSQHAFLYDNGAMQDLGTLDGSTTHAHGINETGDVVGYSSTSSGTHAFFYRNGMMADLGTLGGENSVAYGINGKGQVVG
jgi:probable HAF family extracellular repeat protein